ncbi:M3 family peptidase, partial [Streptacidiphilus sp. ASG 303]|nr:M3 family peptidase [Streptacidiphilus sp. ASG 303]
SLRLLERWPDRFVRAGAQLSEAGRQRVPEINQELAAAATAFERNLLAATRDAALVVGTAEELAGLAEVAVAAAAENARELGRDGAYVLSLKNFSNQPELAVL